MTEQERQAVQDDTNTASLEELEAAATIYDKAAAAKPPADCPYCNGQTEYDGDMKHWFCHFCGKGGRVTRQAADLS